MRVANTTVGSKVNRVGLDSVVGIPTHGCKANRVAHAVGIMKAIVIVVG